MHIQTVHTMNGVHIAYCKNVSNMAVNPNSQREKLHVHVFAQGLCSGNARCVVMRFNQANLLTQSV